MILLIDTCKEKRLRLSSSHSVFTPPTARVLGGGKLQVIAGQFQCFISESDVRIPNLGGIVVRGSVFDEKCVWLILTSGTFGLEL